MKHKENIMKKKTFIIVMLILLLGAVALSGCGGKDESDTLVFTSRLWSVPAEQEFVQTEIITPFEEETGIKVDFQVTDDDTLFKQAQIQQDSGNITTDIVSVHSGKMPDWIDAGYIEDVTDLVNSWTDRNFMSTFDQDTNRGGKQYFIPVGADVYLLLANNQALPYLPDGADVNDMSWEEYAQWANNIYEGEGVGKVCVTGIPQNSLIYQFGGTGLSYGAGFPEINSPEAAEAWQVWADMKNGFSPGVVNVANCTDPMKRGETWLTVFHNARAGEVYASNETQYTLGPAPHGPAGIGTIAGVSGYAIMKGSSNREAAEKFLEYITRPDIQVKLAKGTGGFIPPIEEAVEYLGNDAQDEVINKAILVLENGVASGVPSAAYQDWGAVKQVFDDVFIEMILNGDGTVDQARLDNAQTEMEAIKK
jgi:multiple sugar transport system substrate-binding protein